MMDVLVIGAGPAGEKFQAKKEKGSSMSMQPPAPTYNQDHIPRRYKAGKRRASIYWRGVTRGRWAATPQRWRTASPR